MREFSVREVVSGLVKWSGAAGLGFAGHTRTAVPIGTNVPRDWPSAMLPAGVLKLKIWVCTAESAGFLLTVVAVTIVRAPNMID